MCIVFSSWVRMTSEIFTTQEITFESPRMLGWERSWQSSQFEKQLKVNKMFGVLIPLPNRASQICGWSCWIIRFGNRLSPWSMWTARPSSSLTEFFMHTLLSKHELSSMLRIVWNINLQWEEFYFIPEFHFSSHRIN